MSTPATPTHTTAADADADADAPRWAPVHDLCRDLTGHGLFELDPAATLGGVGVDSLSAMELLLAVEECVGRPIAIDALESLRTIGDLTALLDALTEGEVR